MKNTAVSVAAACLLHVCAAPAAFAAQPPQQEEAPAAPSAAPPGEFRQMLDVLGIDSSQPCADGIYSCIQKLSGQLLDILGGATPRICTPEGLMSISAIATALLFKNPALRFSMLGLGGAGMYATMKADRLPSDSIPALEGLRLRPSSRSHAGTPAASHPDSRGAADDGHQQETASPASPASGEEVVGGYDLESSGFFNTVSGPEKHKVKK